MTEEEKLNVAAVFSGDIRNLNDRMGRLEESIQIMASNQITQDGLELAMAKTVKAAMDEHIEKVDDRQWEKIFGLQKFVWKITGAGTLFMALVAIYEAIKK